MLENKYEKLLDLRLQKQAAGVEGAHNKLGTELSLCKFRIALCSLGL